MGRTGENLLPQLLLLAAFLFHTCAPATSPGDAAVLQGFLKGIDNQEPLSSWVGGDPCGGAWAHVKCVGQSVTALEMNNLKLGGSVTPDLNQLKSLISLQLQGNGFTGSLPSLAGLSSLTEAYFGGNGFNTIPGDFFTGLTTVTQIFLDDNRVNSTGWSLPANLQDCSRLQRLSAANTSMSGKLPEFLGAMESLKVLNLAYNYLGGVIPDSFAHSNMEVLRLNNQLGDQPLTGPITPVVSMQSMTTLWLHVNQFNGVIPDGIGDLSSLEELRLNDNMLVGTVPQSLAQLTALKNVTLKGNRLVGPIPKLGADFDYGGNGWCQRTPGDPCDPRVTALLEFLRVANGFTSPCTSSWQGNDPCVDNGWPGIGCLKGTVTSIILQSCQLTGNLSAALADLTGLTMVNLKNNRLVGVIPPALVQVPTLKTLNLYNNSLSGPLPPLRAGLQLDITANPLSGSPQGTGSTPPGGDGSQAPDSSANSSGGGKKKKNVIPVVVPILVLVLLGILLTGAYCMFKRRRPRFMRVQSSSALVVHPRDSSSEKELVKMPQKGEPRSHSGPSELHVDTGSLIIPAHVLRKATNNFREESILGRGGFGVVYRGELEDGTNIAVKRMEAAAVQNKGLNEFRAEIEVLTKVRHRHLVALLGYCIEGNEKLLVYEYMSQGTLSQHLFDNGRPDFQPLTWKQRLSIALDVARGIEYLHSLAQESFIHRDLKPSNILLDDNRHAKVSDFGLVKRSPDGKHSIETRIAGTFGYLAPEYVATGRASTKVDVYSFGVVLMELITGQQALDSTRPEESAHLPTWFKRMRVNRESFVTFLDKHIDGTSTEEFESISRVAELAGHCTAREPYQRPDMSHAVNVLAPMVERWSPSADPPDENSGIDLGLSLSEALRRWQSSESGINMDGTTTSTSSVPRPPGFSSFNSSNMR